MIGTDVLLVILLVIFVVVIINVNIINAKKIRRNQEKVNTTKETPVAEKHEKHTVKPTDDSNFMQQYFNPKEIEVKEVSKTQLEEIKTATGKLETYKIPPVESDDDFNTKADIINSLDRSNTMPDQDEYDIGIRDDEEKEFTSAITQEFESLSPAMKAFIMANVTKSPIHKKGFAPAEENEVSQSEIPVAKPKNDNK